MGFLDSLLRIGSELTSRACDNMSEIQEYKREYSRLSDQELLDEYNKYRGNTNEDAHFRKKALVNLLEQRGYYYAGDGKLRKRELE